MLQSLDKLVRASIEGGVQVNIRKVFGSIIPNNRNDIVKSAIEHEYDYLLFIDSDMVFDGDWLLELLKHKVDIVSGLCVSRCAPYRPVAFVLADDGKYRPREKLDEGRFYSDLDAIGCAFILIKTDVFNKIDRPWFAMPSHGDSIMGEDIYFCKLAKKAGYKVCVDTSLVVGHIGDRAYTIYDHNDYMKQAKEQQEEVDLTRIA